MRHFGILQPIAVRYVVVEDTYRIISGERRFRAALAVGLAEIPCWVQTPQDREILVRQVVENWQRADLAPFEIADALGILRDQQGYSQNEIAAMIGKSKGEVSKYLKLLNLPEEVTTACRNDPTGKLTRKHLEAIADAPTDKQSEIFQHAKEQNLTVGETQRIVTEETKKATGQKTRGAPASSTVRFATRKATVTIQFRRRQVAGTDILEALDAARRMAEKGMELEQANSGELAAS